MSGDEEARNRLNEEYQFLLENKLKYVSTAAFPLEENIFEWYFIISLVHPDTTFINFGRGIELGRDEDHIALIIQSVLLYTSITFDTFDHVIYYGKMLFTNDYPLEAPIISMITPTCWFEPDIPISLELFGFEDWNPNIRVAEILKQIHKYVNDAFEQADEEVRTFWIKTANEKNVAIKNPVDDIWSYRPGLYDHSVYMKHIFEYLEMFYKINYCDLIKRDNNQKLTKRINRAIENIQLLGTMDDPIPIIEEFYAKQIAQIEQGIYSVESKGFSKPSEIQKNWTKEVNAAEETVYRKMYKEIQDLRNGKAINPGEARERIISFYKGYIVQMLYGLEKNLRDYTADVDRNKESAEICLSTFKEEITIRRGGKVPTHEDQLTFQIHNHQRQKKQNEMTVERLLKFNQFITESDLAEVPSFFRKIYTTLYLQMKTCCVKLKNCLFEPHKYIPTNIEEIAAELEKACRVTKAFLKDLPKHYGDKNIALQKVESTETYIRSLIDLVDFRQISDNIVHHFLYALMDALLSTLTLMRLELSFLVSKILPKETFNYHKLEESTKKAEGRDGFVYSVGVNRFAVKTMKKKNLPDVYIKSLSELQDPNILEYIYFLRTKEIKRNGDLPTGILMDYCFESLKSYITIENKGSDRYLSRYYYITWASEIADGMAFLHSKNVIHCDLKPDNVLLNGYGQIKICDIDRAIEDTEEGHQNFEGGTYRYAAPESLAESPDISRDKKMDIWSYGVIIWQMLTRTRPYDEIESVYHLRELMLEKFEGKSEVYPLLEIPINTPERLKNFIQKCLSFNPNDRVPFQTISFMHERSKYFIPISRAIRGVTEEDWKKITKQDSYELLRRADTRYSAYTSFAVTSFLNCPYTDLDIENFYSNI